MIVNAHCLANLPVPISADAVAHAVPDAHHAPTQYGEQQREEIPGTGFLPRPSEQVEEDESGMEDEECDVGCLKHLVGIMCSEDDFVRDFCAILGANGVYD